MRKVLRLLMIISILLGIALSIANFISVNNLADSNKEFKEFTAGKVEKGTKQSDGCYGDPFNCFMDYNSNP